MLSTSLVSVVLLIVWGGFYLFMRKKMFTSKMYFVLLLLMGSAGLFFNPLPLMGMEPLRFSIGNILLFSVLMIITIIPWHSIDSIFKSRPIFVVNEECVGWVRVVSIVLILLSFYSIVYSLPYAITATALGADNVRVLLQDEYMMPKTFFTTMAVGFASFAPIDVLMFYVSLLDKRLKRYSVWLAISSTALMVTNAASAARDAFIFIPLTYLCFYFLFKNSLEKKTKQRIKKVGFVASFLLLLVLGRITIDRFLINSYSTERNSNMVYGTWGYFYQQPYVFDHILDQTNTFYGFSRRLQFLEGSFGVKSIAYDAIYADRIDYMFGTMYAEFYQISGFASLFICLFVYILLFGYINSYHAKRKRFFPLLLSFTIYFIFTVSGMFYFRYGGNNSEFFLYIIILFLSFFVPDVLIKCNR